MKEKKRYWEVERTSTWGARPCKEAVKIEGFRVDVRCTNDPKKVPAFSGKDKWWFGEGTNHRLINGEIARDFPNQKSIKWIIPVEDMDIPRFAEKHGSLIVSMGRDDHDVFDIEIIGTIEIYDDYRE